MEEKKPYIVISLGGSLIAPDGIDAAFLKSFKELIEDKVHDGYRFILITGGGSLARRYQDALKNFSQPTEADLDWVGIYATRLNANLLRLAFGKSAHGEVVIDPTAIPKTDRPIIIGAGWKPGWSTDYVSVIFAGVMGARKVINLSNIDYVYTSDPRKNPEAKPIERVNWRDFRALLPEKWDPGLSAPFDPVAAREAEHLRIELAIMNGANIPNLKNFLEDKPFVGTIIK